MKKFLKKTYFVAVSTFLALVLSIVSFGTYRNEAKAEDDFISDVPRPMIEAFIETAIIDIVNNGGDLSTSAIIVDHQLTGTMNIQNSVFMNCLRSLSQYTEDLKIIVYMGQMRYRDLQTNETTVVAALDTYDALESRSVYALGIWTFDIQLYVSLKAEQERIGEENLPVYIYPRDTIYYDPNGLCIKKFISMGVGFTVQFAWFE